MKILKKNLLALICLFSLTQAFAQQKAYLNTDLSFDERAKELVNQMTLEEKIAQLNYDAPEIKKLGVPAYNWWNESLHGIARNGRATVFPQAIGLAATWDPALIQRITTAISDEGRAKYNASQAIGNTGIYAGLTFWSPNVNIYRDPRWGRGQETYGEDPFLSSRIGVAYVKGLQGDHPTYLKAAACAKHYVVHSGPEGDRHVFNAVPPKKDFKETYLPAFKALVQEADVEIVMCAYNRTFGEVCCGSSYLMQDILRKEWGFNGHVTSDCWALVDFHEYHKVTTSPEESAAMAFKNGINVNCGSVSPYLKGAVEQGLITEAEIDAALIPLMRTRFRLGMFDPLEMNPYNGIGPEVINCQKHQDLAREAAEKSVVLLKNNGVLPLKKDIKRLYVLGPNAASSEVMLGNYFGVSGNITTLLEGITAKVHPGTKINYKYAFLLDRENINPIDWSTGEAQNEAEAIIVSMGLAGLLEGEEGEAIASPTKSDRFDIRLPQNQIAYLKKLRAAGDKPIIVVLNGGSPVAIPELDELCDAIIYAWYPGEQGGNGIANVLFGDVAPSGKLPLTFPKSVDQLPPYEDYAMKGRTYRYMTEEPQYPFGFGLSYTKFTYSDAKVSAEKIKAGEPVTITAKVTNAGKVKGEEVVQLYVTDVEASSEVPLYSLKGFERISLWPGESKEVTFTVSPEDMQMVTPEGELKLEKGEFKLTIAGSSPGKRAEELGAPKPVAASFTVK
ncbi:glycoside hydrolase family 3 C-terminal domain-containing protein [Flammeovirgaceae bacterium SG7u.111]|nr:glycoside hydrolase family 3 C-terminal domain-containing protein [Flammeovirgaceae bacterium SG7u.132]WPO34270.1 glycoside hydrolase family 3 C-terminal domain-containing protein [Flammeovirgaceae bacterium SG7u.111]